MMFFLRARQVAARRNANSCSGQNNIATCLRCCFSTKSTFLDNLPATGSRGQALPKAFKVKTFPDGWPEEKFRLVQFVKEDLRRVMDDVPDIKYYHVGNTDPNDYPYKDIPMNEPIDLDTLNVASLAKPSSEMHCSRLENGLKIVSVDKGGFLDLVVSNISSFVSGLFVDVGSRWETEETFGCSRTIKTLELLGVDGGCTAGRSGVPLAIPLLTGNVVFPRFLSWDTDRKSKEFTEEVDKFNSNVDMQITEALHATAWFNNTLGNRSTPMDRHRKNYNPASLRQFMMDHFSPDRMILVAVNYPHDELCKWVMRAFVDYETVSHTPREKIAAKYTGGESRVELAGQSCHIAIGFETPGGWNSEDLVPLTVLQTLLGGGGSFSTGGPGKGMYTRLYLEVLATYWVESCVAFNTQYSDSGIFGLYITAPHGQAPRMIELLGEQFRKMGDVKEEELSRAKNALKSSIWMNLESRGIILEDIGRQLLLSGKVLSGQELCDLVDRVTPSDIKRMSDSGLGEPITSEEESDDGRNDEEEEQRERLLLRKVMQQHGEHRGPMNLSDNTATAAPHSGATLKSRESLASRYYRNRNLTWSKDKPTNSTNHGASTFSSVFNKFTTRTRLREPHTGRGVSVPVIPVREGYVCHICGEKGHHIRNCPHGTDRKKAKKVKPATGLPRSWLKRISDEDVARLDCDIYSLPDGSFTILEESGPMSLPIEKKIVERFGVSSAAVIHDQLRCPICNGLFRDAVLLPCCGSSYCRSCILSKMTTTAAGGASSLATSCPSCNEPVIESDPSSNQAIQDSVDALLSVGRVELATNRGIHGSASTPSIDSGPDSVQVVPPGTIREIKPPLNGVVPVPLGGRLAVKRAGTTLFRDQKRIMANTMALPHTVDAMHGVY